MAQLLRCSASSYSVANYLILIMNMTIAFSLVLLVASAVIARPQDNNEGPAVEIVRQENVQNEDGSFQYGYETSDGTVVSASGEQRVIGEENEAGTVMKGSYSYTVDGVTYTVNWVADENGFQAEGDHLPQ